MIGINSNDKRLYVNKSGAMMLIKKSENIKKNEIEKLKAKRKSEKENEKRKESHAPKKSEKEIKKNRRNK